jgi:hypothetical protein
MSAVSISTPVFVTYARRIGSSAYDASAGASSVLVQVSFIYESECRENAVFKRRSRTESVG